MKKYIYSTMFAFFGLVALTGCKEEAGTEPGNDSNPVVTVYQYAAKPPQNPDNDCVIRVAANSAVQDTYYYVESEDAKNSRGLSDEAYADYVVSNGQKVNVAPGTTEDVTITGLRGNNIITVVGVNGGQKSFASKAFKGLDWEDVANGTYYFFNSARLGVETAATTLQKCTNEEGLYQLKNVFGEGYSLKFRTTGDKGSDDDGNFEVVSVAAQSTPFEYGKYGQVSIRDVATWQNSDDYLDNAMYENGYCYFWVQYFVSAGNIGYGYDQFIPE